MVVETIIRPLDMRFQAFFQFTQVISVHFDLFIDANHQLVPLLYFSGLVVDGIVDTGQKQADDRGNDQLLILLEEAISLWVVHGPYLLIASSSVMDCLFDLQ